MAPIRSLLAASLFLLSCMHAPLKMAQEKRFSDGMLSGFSSAVVESTRLSSNGRALFFGTKGGRVYAVSSATGAVFWKADLEGAVTSGIGVGPGLVYAGTSKGRFYALREADGKEVWRFDLPGEVLGEPVTFDGAVLFGANDGGVYALAAENGEFRWRHRRDLPDRMTVSGFAGVSGDGERVYTAFSDGAIAALKMENGEPVWVKNVPSQQRLSDVTTLLLVDRTRFLAGQFDGALYALNPAGEIEWVFPQGGTAAPMLLAGSSVVVPMSSNRIARLEASGGGKVWEYDAGETAHWSGVTLWGKLLLAAAYEGRVHVIDAETGKRRWVYDFGSAVEGAPRVEGEKAWVLTRKGRLFSLLLR